MQAKSAPHRSIAVAKDASPPYVGRHDGKIGRFDHGRRLP